jgi:hypothetical protein
VIQDVVEWCGGAITLREARRFRQLVNIPQWSDSAAALRGVTVPLVGGSSRSARCRRRQRPGRWARTCGDSAKFFTSAQGRLTNGPARASRSISM